MFTRITMDKQALHRHKHTGAERTLPAEPKRPSAPPPPIPINSLRSALTNLLTKSEFHDVEFAVGGERIGAVMALIAARSKSMGACLLW